MVVFHGSLRDLPSGHVNIAIENDPVEVVDFSLENGDVPYLLV